MSVSTDAITRRRKIMSNDRAIYKDTDADATLTSAAVSKIAPPKSSFRETTSAKDLRQIKDRQEAEALPEGNIRRKRKSIY